jgi:hypothetical protein
LVSSNFSSDYSFGIFKLLLITPLVSSSQRSNQKRSLKIPKEQSEEEFEDTKGVIRRSLKIPKE